jgi:5-methyltetrahydropteroyltriglutamate--homocysteine methyltransferase
MKRSTDRILTTHIGSLPRPAELAPLIQARAAGSPVDAQDIDRRVRAAVDAIVKRQADIGIDIVADGEMGKPSFVTYVNERLTGFVSEEGERPSLWASSREHASFPEYYQAVARTQSIGLRRRQLRTVCRGPIAYKGEKLLQDDLSNLKLALRGVKAVEAFVPAIAPSNVEVTQPNEHYPNERAYLYALADAMRTEYRAIIDAGFLLQIDDPFLVTYYITRPDLSLAQIRKWAELRVEALNHAIAGLPAERIRFHTCYGINFGPRVHDMQLKDIGDIILKVKAGAYSFEAANPRHDHEWADWAKLKLRPGTILIPGVITQSSVLVEHPELIAQRIVRYAGVVGRDNVIAGADCGFASFAGSDEIHESIVWAKLAAMVEGARIASRQLWGGARRKTPARPARKAVKQRKPGAVRARRSSRS